MCFYKQGPITVKNLPHHLGEKLQMVWEALMQGRSWLWKGFKLQLRCGSPTDPPNKLAGPGRSKAIQASLRLLQAVSQM